MPQMGRKCQAKSKVRASVHKIMCNEKSTSAAVRSIIYIITVRLGKKSSLWLIHVTSLSNGTKRVGRNLCGCFDSCIVLYISLDACPSNKDRRGSDYSTFRGAVSSVYFLDGCFLLKFLWIQEVQEIFTKFLQWEIQVVKTSSSSSHSYLLFYQRIIQMDLSGLGCVWLWSGAQRRTRAAGPFIHCQCRQQMYLLLIVLYTDHQKAQRSVT